MEREDAASAPIIPMTADSTPEARQCAASVEMNGDITKPQPLIDSDLCWYPCHITALLEKQAADSFVWLDLDMSGEMKLYGYACCGAVCLKAWNCRTINPRSERLWRKHGVTAKAPMPKAAAAFQSRIWSDKRSMKIDRQMRKRGLNQPKTRPDSCAAGYYHRKLLYGIPPDNGCHFEGGIIPPIAKEGKAVKRLCPLLRRFNPII